MADITISSLPLGTPSGNGLIPFSQNGSTSSVILSSLYNNTIFTNNIKPAFHVFNQVAQTLFGNTVMQFNSTSTNPIRVFNQGNYYSNNRFTAPISGVYHFSVNVLLNGANGGGNYWGIGLVANGQDTFDFSYGAGATQQSLNLSTTVKLAVNDYVDVRGSTNASGGILIDNSGSFSGHFVG